MPSGDIVAGLGAAFQIGRSALAAYQAAITITGQNIANVGNPDYTRQSGRLASVYSGAATGTISPGIGVRLDSLQRHTDAAVESRLRLAYGMRSGAELTYQTLSRVEALYNELTEYDLSSQLNEFFKSLADLQTDPLETASRNLVVSNADAIIRTLQRQRSGLLDQIHDLNTQTEAMTRSANGIVEEIAKLNALVVTTEARAQGGSGALRDRRDALLRQLGELIDIQTREHENGIVNVYVGSEPLVDFDRTRGLTTVTTVENGLERTSVRFADNNGSVILRSGRLAATVAARDVHLVGQLEQIDQLAEADWRSKSGLGADLRDQPRADQRARPGRLHVGHRHLRGPQRHRGAQQHGRRAAVPDTERHLLRACPRPVQRADDHPHDQGRSRRPEQRRHDIDRPGRGHERDSGVVRDADPG